VINEAVSNQTRLPSHDHDNLRKRPLIVHRKMN
jgi:hypothetical protein